MVTDPIIWNRDHGRSKIHDGFREGEVKKPPTAPPVPEISPVDSFEKTSIPAGETNGKTVSGKAGGLKISYHFDLFYELSQKVSARMGQKGLNRFTEVTASVAETFKGSFQLNIDAVGSFLNGTDKSLAISPEVANRFMDSVDELSGLSPNALENFLREADRFFADLETTYGDANGAFDEIRDQMKSQATRFFDGVSEIREGALAEAESQSPVAGGVPQVPSLPVGKDEKSQAPVNPIALIPLSDGSGMEFPATDYQSFVNNFLKYVDQFRKNLVKDFLTPAIRPVLLGSPSEATPGILKGVSHFETPQISKPSDGSEEPIPAPKPPAGETYG